jgi:amino acid permease
MVNVAFIFNFLYNFFPIFKGMRRVNDTKMRKACFYGTLWVAIPYILIGFLGCAIITGSPE